MKQRTIIRVFKTLKNMLSKYRIDTRLGKVYNRKTKKEVALGTDRYGYHILKFERNGIRHSVLRSNMVFWAKHKYVPAINRCIDHKNGIITDDRASNLQDISNAENLAKKIKHKNKFYGVCKKHNGYRGRVMKNRINYVGKTYATETEAAMARDQLVVQHYWNEYHERGFLPPLNFPDRLPNYIQNVKNPRPRTVQLELNF